MVEKTHSLPLPRSRCVWRVSLAILVRRMERLALAAFGGVVLPSQSVRLTLKVPSSRSMSSHFNPRSSP